MLEDVIVQLDQMGVEYTEDYNDGTDGYTLTVAVSSLDKVQLIDVINLANESGLEFTVDEASLVIVGENAPAEPGPVEEQPEGGEEDYQAAAFEDIQF